MPIRTLPSRAIADASIQAVDIASNSISKAKIDADTRLGLQNDSIIFDLFSYIRFILSFSILFFK